LPTSQIVFPTDKFILLILLRGSDMPKTNVVGSMVISVILLAITGYALHVGISINWQLYIKIGAVVLVIAAIIGIASAGGDKA
jgi:hypothetical protein